MDALKDSYGRNVCKVIGTCMPRGTDISEAQINRVRRQAAQEPGSSKDRFIMDLCTDALSASNQGRKRKAREFVASAHNEMFPGESLGRRK